jgi:zinc D-Ala-D-Ala carboxypeptidase
VAILVVALSASACGTTEPTARSQSTDRTQSAARSRPSEGAPPGLPQLRPARDSRPEGDPVDPFDVGQQTLDNLDPDLLDALQAAARDAQDDGVTMVVNSGWRSRAHQERLFAEAVSKYGSEEEARRWVSTPDTSAHVTGDAVDIGPSDADDWLSQHGSDYGLCQTFANEAWHYELATTPGGRCPDMLPDSSSRR